jgi:hypothetical protein
MMLQQEEKKETIDQAQQLLELLWEAMDGCKRCRRKAKVLLERQQQRSLGSK